MSFINPNVFALLAILLAPLAAGQDIIMAAEDDYTPNCNSSAFTYYAPHIYDCTKFFACSKGVASDPIPCPNNLYFNPNLQKCDLPQTLPPTAECLQAPTPSTTPAPPSSCSNASDGTYLPDPINCSVYYICINGTGLEQACPGGLYFNPETTRCVSFQDLPPTTPCLQTPPPDTTLAPPVTCSNATDGTYLPDPIDCQLYYICIGGDSLEFSCPEGLFFNPESERCVSFESLPPSTPCLSTPAPSTTERPQPTCTNATDGTYLPDPVNCQVYYICVAGNATEYSCPSDLYFNPDTLRCVQFQDLPPTAPCLQNPITTEKPEQTCQTSPDGTYLPNPANCSAYYICQNGTGFPYTCPAGLLFNPETSRCELAENLPPGTPCLNSPLEQCKTAPTGTYYSHPYSCAEYYICVRGFAELHRCPVDMAFHLPSITCVWPWLLPLTDSCYSSSPIDY